MASPILFSRQRATTTTEGGCAARAVRHLQGGVSSQRDQASFHGRHRRPSQDRRLRRASPILPGVGCCPPPPACPPQCPGAGWPLKVPPDHVLPNKSGERNTHRVPHAGALATRAATERPGPPTSVALHQGLMRSPWSPWTRSDSGTDQFPAATVQALFAAWRPQACHHNRVSADLRPKLASC